MNANEKLTITAKITFLSRFKTWNLCLVHVHSTQYKQGDSQTFDNDWLLLSLFATKLAFPFPYQFICVVGVCWSLSQYTKREGSECTIDRSTVQGTHTPFTLFSGQFYSLQIDLNIHISGVWQESWKPGENLFRLRENMQIPHRKALGLTRRPTQDHLVVRQQCQPLS